MISIIIPIYNSASFLSKCLNSIINQIYEELEIICINDGSTDESLEILRKYKEEDSRIKIVSHENRGISYSRNEGVAMAKGKWIMFVDSDDWIDIDTCKVVSEIAENEKCDVVMWSYIREFKNKSLPKYYLKQEKKWLGKNEVALIHRRIFGPINEELNYPDSMDAYGTVWAKLYRRECVRDIKFIDTKEVGSAEDVLFNAELFSQINNVVFTPHCFYHYRKYGMSYTNSCKRDLYKKWENLYDRLDAVIRKNNLSYSFKEALRNRICLGIIGLGLNELYFS